MRIKLGRVNAPGQCFVALLCLLISLPSLSQQQESQQTEPQQPESQLSEPQEPASRQSDPESSASLTEADPFAALLGETRPRATILETDYYGVVELGLAYSSDDNVRFGEYSGLADSGFVLLGNLHWQQWTDNQSWKIEADDIGLKSRSGLVEWRYNNSRLWFSLENSIQTRDSSGRTPFRGESNLSLPTNWVPGNTTSEFLTLNQNLRRFTRETERQQYSLGFASQLINGWSISSRASIENKQGTSDIGGAIFIDAASAQAVLLPQTIDYRSSEIELGLNYSGKKLQLNSNYLFSDFNNNDALLQWQNPYLTNLGTQIDYPVGEGGLALAPDNQYQRLRALAVYPISDRWRFNMDASLARSVQDATFANYSVNSALTVDAALPRSSLDGRVDTETFAAGLNGRLSRKISLELSYRAQQRDNRSPRDAYRYIRGDGSDQPQSKYILYNTTHDNLKQTAGVKIHYRLPQRTKLSLAYRYEQTQRENVAVETTDENIVNVSLSSRIVPALTLRFDVIYSDLAADTYYWDQSYYSLVDPELINETPDNQRFINHPLLSQYFLSNREQTQLKMDATYQFSESWQTAFNFLWRDDDYDQTTLGLTAQRYQHINFLVNYFPSQSFTLTGYINISAIDNKQMGRDFRGGIEKDPFAVNPPLPQASDPTRNWTIAADDQWLTTGFNVVWQASAKLDLKIDYSFVDSGSRYDLSNGGASDLDNTDFPDQTSRIHHLQIIGEYHLRNNVSLKTDYQYYRDSGENWSKDQVTPTSVNRVLTFGDSLANEVVHYLGVSALYRW